MEHRNVSFKYNRAQSLETPTKQQQQKKNYLERAIKVLKDASSPKTRQQTSDRVYLFFDHLTTLSTAHITQYWTEG
jgi:hypothetical protein